jgi:uncharacterized protein YdeI (YjbR/CyaY-like superfamily)
VSPVQRPSRAQVTIFDTAADFRAWLETKHDSAGELFVGFYRKGSDLRAMTYPESVDEALCYGWIDGITFRIDDELRATRFTPRRRSSNWSAVNIAKVAELTASGRMHPSGTRAFTERDRRKDAYANLAGGDLPDDMLERLEADAAAWVDWKGRPASFRRQAAAWVTSAKRPETRERRFRQLLEASRDGRKPKRFIVAAEERP